MKRKLLLSLFIIAFLFPACASTVETVESDKVVEIVETGETTKAAVTEPQDVIPETATKTELSEEALQDEVSKRYYAGWKEEDMIAEINHKSSYLEKCSFYSEVVNYLETEREVTDISGVMEPLFHTDMKYYTKEELENVPSLIIYLAKNELYARHGYIFKNSELNDYFMGQLWYQPTCEAKDFQDTVFNEYEKENLKLLVSLDDYKNK